MEQTELITEIQNSFILKFYNFLIKIYSHIETFKIVTIISFFIGALSLFFEKLHTLALVFLVPVFVVGVTFAFVGAIIHFLVYLKIKNLSKKYKTKEQNIKNLITEIYEN